MFKRLLAVLTAGVAAVVFIGCGGEEPTSPKNAPQITQQPVSVSAYVGQSVSLYVIATAKPAPTYQWRKDGVDIVGATQWEYVISSVTAADSGIYTVVVSNSEGSVTSSGGTLTVWTPPEITLQPVSQTVGEGGSVTFTVSAMGNPLPTYQWRYNYADISGETSSTLQISGVTPGDAGLYDVVVSNGAGTVLSTVATLTVTQMYPVLLTPADGATNVSVTPTFTWEAFPGAASYEIEVGTTPDVSTGWVVYDGNVTSTTYTPGGPLANATVYYWHVLAHDGGGGVLGTWSLISSFTTEP
jgi:hypothetical protein